MKTLTNVSDLRKGDHVLINGREGVINGIYVTGNQRRVVDLEWCKVAVDDNDVNTWVITPDNEPPEGKYNFE